MKSTLKKIWTLFSNKEKRKAILMLCLAIMMAIFEALGVLSIVPFLTVLSRQEVIQEQAFLNYFYQKLQFSSGEDFIVALGILSIAMVLASSMLKTITQHLLNRFVHMQRHSVSTRLLSKYLHQRYEFFLGRNSAELAKNVLSETDQLMFSMIQPLSQLIVQGVVVLAMSLLIVIYDPLTALAVLLTLGLLYLFIYSLVRKRLGSIGKEVVNANRERYTSCNEALSGIRDIKMTHATSAYMKRYSHASHTYARHFATSDTLSQTPLYWVEATGYTGLILITIFLLTKSNDIAQVLPALGLYGFAAYRLLPAIQIMYRGFARLRFTSAALENIQSDLILQEEQFSNSEDILIPRKEIRLENIRFSYPLEPDKAIFNNYNLTIPANTLVGIKGKSGAGKSTLMDLLLGLIHPQEGSFWIDDISINQNNIQAWQKAIGYVPQHIYLVDASVAANIAFGVPEDKIDYVAVERAAKIAQIHDFIINDLPQGYTSVIGERGIRLSGGQRQRIGIARALYKDPPVLFMDEATSALDEETKQELNEEITGLSLARTIIIIAHHEASINSCSTIISLDSKY
jgi:ABC-type multidrug transport system fused ATPase/permease subunit